MAQGAAERKYVWWKQTDSKNWRKANKGSNKKLWSLY